MPLLVGPTRALGELDWVVVVDSVGIRRVFKRNATFLRTAISESTGSVLAISDK